MDCLFQCLGDEFKDVEFASMNIHPTHTVMYSRNGNEENVITLTVTIYNQIHKLVGKKIFRFINDKYKVTPAKKLDYITPEQIDSAFMISKEAILQEIYDDYIVKFNSIAEKVKKLEKYHCPEPQQE